MANTVIYNMTLEPGLTVNSGPPAPGQVSFTTPGTYSWIAPAGVTSVSVVCVGGGGSGLAYHATTYYGYNTYLGGGGAGGGLGWKNSIAVLPGNTYTVVVGSGGATTGYSQVGASAGTDSYFISNTLVKGGGGSQCQYYNQYAYGGSYVGDGGGNGGGTSGGVTYVPGGGGAGGYSGNGGEGGGGYGFAYVVGKGYAGAGGGGGGGAGYYVTTNGYSNYYNNYSTYLTSGRGGGVGILGQGTSGAEQPTQLADGYPGSNGVGKTYGGGGRGSIGESAGGGAVRIIWGNNRSFPSTNTGDV